MGRTSVQRVFTATDTVSELIPVCEKRSSANAQDLGIVAPSDSKGKLGLHNHRSQPTQLRDQEHTI